MALFPTGLDDSQESMFGEPDHHPEPISDSAREEYSDEDAAQQVELTADAEAKTVEHQAPVAVTAPEQEIGEAVEPEQPLTVDDFAALEERVVRAVSLVRRERQARAQAEEKGAALQAELLQQLPLVEKLQQEVNALRAEREQVRQRVERLLRQLDVLEL
jgi:chromosome segregation ATPase